MEKEVKEKKKRSKPPCEHCGNRPNAAGRIYHKTTCHFHPDNDANRGMGIHIERVRINRSSIEQQVKAPEKAVITDQTIIRDEPECSSMQPEVNYVQTVDNLVPGQVLPPGTLLIKSGITEQTKFIRQWIPTTGNLPSDLTQVLICLKTKYVRPSLNRDWIGWTIADAVFQDMLPVWDAMDAERRSQYLTFENFTRNVGRYVWHGQGTNRFNHEDVTHWMALPEGPNAT